ncbi:MAG: Dabb family protein [Mangrovibacterium sp.]
MFDLEELFKMFKDEVTHQVFFKFKPSDELEEDLKGFRSRLKALQVYVPGIVSLEVRILSTEADAEYHFQLEVIFLDQKYLEQYMTHPSHVRVSEWVKDKIESRKASDFRFKIVGDRLLPDPITPNSSEKTE